MWSDELEYCMRDLRGFRGVYSADNLPAELPVNSDEYPISLIVNVLPSWIEKGGHWLALIFPRKGEAIYFDSFAQPIPADAARVRRLLQKQMSVQGSPFRIQCYLPPLPWTDNFGECGEFCVYVLYNLPRYFYNLEMLICREFSEDDCRFNRRKVLGFTHMLTCGYKPYFF